MNRKKNEKGTSRLGVEENKQTFVHVQVKGKRKGLVRIINMEKIFEHLV